MTHSSRSALTLGVLSLCLAVVASAQSTYTVTDLGTLGGHYSIGRGINSSGQVTGRSAFADDTTLHPFLYSGGTMADLGTLGGAGTNAEGGIGINASGQVTGGSFTTSGDQHAFLYSSGVMHDLGTLPGYTGSLGWGINTSGQVAGYSFFPTGFRAFLYNAGVMSDLGTLGGADSFAYSINDAGQITGQADTASSGAHAFLYSGGSMTDLGVPAGYDSSAGYGINSSAQITGLLTAGSVLHAFLYSGGAMMDLGTLGGTESWGYGINSSGQVVGYSKNAPNVTDFFSRAFLYTPATGMVDLNNLIPPASGWTLQEAHAINDAGQIAGLGVSPSGAQHAFLLTPVPVHVVGAGTIAVAHSRIPAAFAFDVKQPKGSAASGSLVYLNLATGDAIAGKINSLVVVGNIAYLSGSCVGRQVCTFSIIAQDDDSSSTSKDSLSISGAAITPEGGPLTSGRIEIQTN